jgi:hypothetical protein
MLKIELTKTGELYMAGINKSGQLVLIKLNASGKQSSKFIIPTMSDVVNIANLKLSASNELLIGANTSQGAVFLRLNDKGQILSDLRFNSIANRIKDFSLTQQGGTLLLMENNRSQTGWDILLIKLK